MALATGTEWLDRGASVLLFGPPGVGKSHLAVALARPANLLVLDEPTNDLDMDTLEALEAMLESYDGAILLISHDRAFLDGVVTQIVGPSARGAWVETPGGWSDFEREHGGFASPSAPRASKRAAPAPAPAAPRKTTKLSYKDERRAGELEAALPQHVANIAELEQTLADPELFARDPALYRTTSERLHSVRARFEAEQTEWLEIELRREALEQGA